MSFVRFLILSIAICAALPAWAGNPVAEWETVRTDVAADIESAESERIDVQVRDGAIYVTTPKAQTVRVLSILGQQISQQKIPEGTSRLKITARGIYILKIGTITKRVTI